MEMPSIDFFRGSYLIEYIKAIKRQFRDVYNFVQRPPGHCFYCVGGTIDHTDWTGAVHDEVCSECNGSGVANNTEPFFDNIPDGDYPMTINGKLDNVKLMNGFISCCNFDE